MQKEGFLIVQHQSELPRPIKIGLGCVCGVEISTKIASLLLAANAYQNSSVARVVSAIKIDNFGDPKYSVNRSNIVYLLS